MKRFKKRVFRKRRFRKRTRKMRIRRSLKADGVYKEKSVFLVNILA